MNALPECFGRFQPDYHACRLCMVDVNCYAKASLTAIPGSLPVFPPYSRADAAKRMILSGQFLKQRNISDLKTAYNLKDETAKTHIRDAFSIIDYFFSSFYAESKGIAVYTVAQPKEVASITRKLFLDDRNRNYFLDVPPEIGRVFEENSDTIERAPSLPKQCRTIVCMGSEAERYAKRSATKVLVSFTSAYFPIPEAFWAQLGYACTFQVIKYFMAPFIVGIFKR